MRDLIPQKSLAEAPEAIDRDGSDLFFAIDESSCN